MLNKTIAALIFTVCTATAFADTTQERVHGMSHGVMPFDMTKTIHIFAMTDVGGIQKVVIRDDRDSGQVALIRQHLRHESEAFQKGDFSDPGHLHGATMPGLVDLKSNVARIHVTYEDLPNGAQISFEATNQHTVTAIHRWFGAQLSEHGADARSE
jgi:hypothetical protein